MDFTLPPRIEALRPRVQAFVREQLEPISRQVEDEDRIPREVVRAMGEEGLLGVPFPEEYGGLGLGELGQCVVLEELGATNACFSNLLGASSGLCGTALWLDGTPEQKQRYLRPLARGEMIGAFALTEPGAGSDAASITTRAVRRGDRYYLTGKKHWVTNGPEADVLVVIAVTDEALGPRGGITAFLVEPDFPGFRRGAPTEKMGMRGTHICELVLEECEVPAENVLGQVGLGFLTAMKTLDVGRISLGAGAVGSSQALLQRCIEFARERRQFGRPIGANQAIQWMIADSAAEIHAGRLMVYHAAWKLDQGQRVSQEAAMVKLFCSELAGRVADRAVQIHGGLGYLKERPIERAYRDARILRIYEGTSEIQRLIIAEQLLGRL